MAIVYQTDKRSGITYAYESKAYWDKEKKQSRTKRTLIGRVNEKGEIGRSPIIGEVLEKQKKIYEALDIEIPRWHCYV